MNKLYIVETLTLLGEAAVIYLLYYFIAIWLSSFINHTGEKKTRFKLMIASIICFTSFLLYGLAANYLNLEISILESIWFILFPFSLIMSIVFTVLFIIQKKAH